MLFRYGRHRVVRAVGILYPLTTALVVMGTANHYLMDAAAGVATMGVGFLLAKPALRTVDRVQGRVHGALAARRGQAGAETVVASSVPGVTPVKVPSPRTVSVPPGAPGDADRDPDASGGSGAGRGERSRMS
jgi:hypothetical protein